MNRKAAAAALSALLYAQALLGVAAIGAALIRTHTPDIGAMAVAAAPSAFAMR